MITVRALAAPVLKEGATGEEREKAFTGLFESMDRVAMRVETLPEEEVIAAIEEALAHVRRDRE